MNISTKEWMWAIFFVVLATFLVFMSLTVEGKAQTREVKLGVLGHHEFEQDGHYLEQRWKNMLSRTTTLDKKGWNWLRGKLPREQIWEVNNSVNVRIKWKQEQDDYWQTPEETAMLQTGDCEDYAITKYMALLALGFDEDRLRFVVVRDTKRKILHSVVIADGLVLDNLFSIPVEERFVKNYRPIWSATVTRSWMHLGR